MNVYGRRVSSARQALILLLPLLLVLGCGSATRTAQRPHVVIAQQEGFQSVRVHVDALVEVRLLALPGLNPISDPGHEPRPPALCNRHRGRHDFDVRGRPAGGVGEVPRQRVQVTNRSVKKA